MCVEIVSLGKMALSTSSTLNPRRARSIAVGEPAHRAPTMMASYIETSARETRVRRFELLRIDRTTQFAALGKLGNSEYADQVRW
jgi:hypothetical protein